VFLRNLSDNDFRDYLAPLGFSNSTKKYKCWCPDLHNYMNKNVEYFTNEYDFTKHILQYFNENMPGKILSSYDENEFKRYYLLHKL